MKRPVAIIATALLIATSCGGDDDADESIDVVDEVEPGGASAPATETSAVASETSPTPMTTDAPVGTTEIVEPPTTDPPATTATTDPPAPSGDAFERVAAIASELEAGNLCSNVREYVVAEDEQLDLGIEIEAELVCDTETAGEAYVGKMASPGAIRAFAAVIVSFYEAFGIDPQSIYLLELDDGIAVSANNDDDDLISSDATLAWLELARDQLGGDIRTVRELADDL